MAVDDSQFASEERELVSHIELCIDIAPRVTRRDEPKEVDHSLSKQSIA